MKKSTRVMIDLIASWLLIVGGLNWGLAIFDINLVTMLSNATNLNWLADVIYGVVGVSSLYVAYRAVMGKLMK